MTVKEKLHRLVNALPESELTTAERYLKYLAQSTDPVALALELAADDDEPATDADRAAEPWEALETAECFPFDAPR